MTPILFMVVLYLEGLGFLLLILLIFLEFLLRYEVLALYSALLDDYLLEVLQKNKKFLAQVLYSIGRIF